MGAARHMSVRELSDTIETRLDETIVHDQRAAYVDLMRQGRPGAAHAALEAHDAALLRLRAKGLHLLEPEDSAMDDDNMKGAAPCVTTGRPVPCGCCDCNAECDCGGIVPGALWPWAPNGDASLPWVERCEDCQRFDCDDDAAFAVAEAIGGRVMFAAIPLDGECSDIDHERLHPFVLPGAPVWAEAMPS